MHNSHPDLWQCHICKQMLHAMGARLKKQDFSTCAEAQIAIVIKKR
jgi:hypothetical protein